MPRSRRSPTASRQRLSLCPTATASAARMSTIIVLVDDDAIRAAMALLFREMKLRGGARGRGRDRGSGRRR